MRLALPTLVLFLYIVASLIWWSPRRAFGNHPHHLASRARELNGYLLEPAKIRQSIPFKVIVLRYSSPFRRIRQ